MNYVSSVFSELEQWKDTLERSRILQQQDMESGTEEPYISNDVWRRVKF